MPKEDFLWESLISINLGSIKAMGLWPYNAKINIYNAYSVFVLLTSCWMVFLEGFSIYMFASDPDMFLRTILIAAGSILALAKILIFTTNIKKIDQAIAQVKAQRFAPKNKHQEGLARASFGLWMKSYKIIIGSCGISTVLFIILPIVTGAIRDFQFPYVIYCPFNCRRVISYVFIYLCQAFFLVVSCAGGYNIDMLFFAFLTFISTQCELLCDNLRALSPGTEAFHREIHGCIKHHQRILSFVRYCNGLGNLILLIQFGASVVIISFTLFELSAISIGTQDFYQYSTISLVYSGQIVGYCLFGEIVQIKSNRIQYAIFKSLWIDQDPADRKSLVMFLINTQDVIRISSYKLFVLSLETYLKIMKTAWSYFLVLQQVNSNSF